MAASVIKLQDITKVFATEEVETHALSSVSVEINKGDYVSIAGPSGAAARAPAQPRDRIYFPELQPDWRFERGRKRRAAARLPRHQAGGPENARGRGARARGHGAPREAHAEPAIGRPAAARGGGARGGRRARHPARRRADGQSGFEK